MYGQSDIHLLSSVDLAALVDRLQLLNHQSFKALPACELINLTSLVGRLYTGSALNV